MNNDNKNRNKQLYPLLQEINDKLDVVADKLNKNHKLKQNAKAAAISANNTQIDENAEIAAKNEINIYADTDNSVNNTRIDERAKIAAKHEIYVSAHPDTSLAKKYKIKEKDILNKRRGFSERLTYVIVFIVFAIYALSLLAPIYYLLVNSLEGLNSYLDKTAAGNTFALPIPPRTYPHWKNYGEAFREMVCRGKSSKTKIGLPAMFFNSLWYTILTAIFGIISSSFSAYALSRYKFIGRNLIYGIAIFTMTVPIIGSLGASIKLIKSMNLMNTPLYLVTAFGGLGFNFLVLYGFFKNLSWSYAEAVFIDGGGHFTAFFKIMLPQAKASIFTLFLMAFIGAWNDYQTPLLYLPDYQTLASGLYKIQTRMLEEGRDPLLYAGLFISMVPVIILFSCFSNTIMKNFTMGGLKG